MTREFWKTRVYSRDKDGCSPNIRVPMVFIVLSRDYSSDIYLRLETWIYRFLTGPELILRIIPG